MEVTPQSVFDTASDGARWISELSWLLIIGATLVFVAVMALLVKVVRSGASEVRPGRWLIGGGVVLPGVALALLLAKGLGLGVALSHAPEVRGLEVEVIARRWWWELRYRHPEGEGQVVLANELHLPLDCIAVLRISTEDVIHSFWVPALAGKVDAIPGRTNQLVIHAAREGRFRGQCAEYCGTQHANMALEVVVQSPQAFREWLLNQARPAVAQPDAESQRGAQVFHSSGCATCHTIRGTSAAGALGPDLTHLASRRWIGAATAPNTTESLARWIRSAQHVKPGSLMPSLAGLDDADLRALTRYLGGLQ